MRPQLLLIAVVGLLTAGSPNAQAAPLPLVVIDPGHGGTNRGALGPASGRCEKQLTLLLARQAASELTRIKRGVRVRLTRRRDRYLTLAQRVELANRWGATLFVSLHLNASRSRSQSGFETYVLSPAASDREAARLAHAENGGATANRPGAPKGDIAAILGDLQQRAAHPRSLRLAQALQRALASARPSAENRGVRQAPFDVLLGLRMPAALVEAGFIDHPLEGLELVKPAVQARIAQAIAQGIATFLTPPTRKPARKRPHKLARAAKR